MSFFGFDASRQSKAPGFSQVSDPFAGLSGGIGQNNNNNNGNNNNNNNNDNNNAYDDALEFDDTYDGLGDELEESGDAFNDDTFGGGNDDLDTFGGGIGGGAGGAGGGAAGKVGNDFDFFGQTARVSSAIEEEHARFNRLQPVVHQQQQHAPISGYDYGGNMGGYYPPTSSSKPVRSGYEKYKEEPDMEVDAALWGVAPKKPAASASAAAAAAAPSSSTPSGRKILSLEEVEAAMRAQNLNSQPPVTGPTTTTTTAPPPPPPVQIQPRQDYSAAPPPPGFYGIPPVSQAGPLPPIDGGAQFGPSHPMAILQRPQSQQTPPGAGGMATSLPPPLSSGFQQVPPPMPTQILQNPNRQGPGIGIQGAQGIPQPPSGHQRQQSSFSGIITHPSQLAHLTGEEKAAHLDQDAKRAKRNYKIYLLSKDNGLMTPQDKNFVTRIQLQQLVSAAGNPNEHGTDEALKEDFYYQVLSQIRGSARQHPSQPLNNFAQTYLFQTGSRFHHSRRFLHRDRAENHMQRMEQQVQRAVEAAKNRPKSKQLVIEGSLGKISFSNAKTPKPLLNIKRVEAGSGTGTGTGTPAGGAGAAGGAGDRPASSSHNKPHPTHHHNVNRKTVLYSIEKVYLTLMELEDHDRKMPPPPADANDLDLAQRHLEWSETKQQLSSQLWRELKVHEPIGEFPVHPFIAFLSFAKGKRAIPRVFRQLSHELRATVLTMIVVHLDQLDVVRDAQVDRAVPCPPALRESIELFSQAVMGTLFSFMADLHLDLVTGVLGLITSLRVDLVAKSRIGASMLTMIVSRAEIIKQTGGGTPEQWHAWEVAYTKFFDTLEPTLPYMFPGTVSSSEDIYVWQLLAALGIGANADQQQRLVLAVKDRVMGTVTVAKTLPVDLATQRLANVNLFMRSIGLDVELLQ